MQVLKALNSFLCTALIFATLGVTAKADEWNKKTIVTFPDSVEVPGQVLPAGTYVFKLMDSNANRHIVQIWSGDETEIYATILAIPASRFRPPDRPIFEFDERPGDSPQALRAWFYPGDTTGNEFVYPRTRYLASR